VQGADDMGPLDVQLSATRAIYKLRLDSGKDKQKKRR
jgi:hypothetical protein